MLIAVIDDGINFRTYPELKVEYDFVVEENGVIRPRGVDDSFSVDHGTTCARIIHAYAPEASFCSLDIFTTEKFRTNIKQLVSALHWCYEQKVPLIHLSVGSTRLSDYEPLQKIVSRMLCQGQVLVAAHSNKTVCYTMPACFSGVLGVVADPQLVNYEFRVTDNLQPDNVSLMASARHKLRNADGVHEETQLSNSYAAPTITASAHEILKKQNSSFPLAEFWRKLIHMRTIPVTSLRPDFMGTSIVYDPAGSLTHKRKQLAFEVLGSYTDSSEFINALIADPCAPALIMPPLPSSDNNFWNELLEWSKKRIGIVCSGTAPQWVRANASGLFWDEQVRQTLVHKCHQEAVVEVPVLQVKPYCEKVLLFIPKLKHFLAANNIECLALSDYPQSYLYGVEWLLADYEPENIMVHLCQTAHPDMILCMLHSPLSRVRETATLIFTDFGKATFDTVLNQAVFPFQPTEEDFRGLLEWMT